MRAASPAPGLGGERRQPAKILTLQFNLVTVPFEGCEVGSDLAGTWGGRAAIC